jgi:hypothetical protein
VPFTKGNPVTRKREKNNCTLGPGCALGFPRGTRTPFSSSWASVRSGAVLPTPFVLQNQVLNLIDLKAFNTIVLTLQVLFQFAKDIKTSIYQGWHWSQMVLQKLQISKVSGYGNSSREQTKNPSVKVNLDKSIVYWTLKACMEHQLQWVDWWEMNFTIYSV